MLFEPCGRCPGRGRAFALRTRAVIRGGLPVPANVPSAGAEGPSSGSATARTSSRGPAGPSASWRALPPTPPMDLPVVRFPGRLTRCRPHGPLHGRRWTGRRRSPGDTARWARGGPWSVDDSTGSVGPGAARPAGALVPAPPRARRARTPRWWRWVWWRRGEREPPGRGRERVGPQAGCRRGTPRGARTASRPGPSGGASAGQPPFFWPPWPFWAACPASRKCSRTRNACREKSVNTPSTPSSKNSSYSAANEP